jgi:hypothetical protein
MCLISWASPSPPSPSPLSICPLLTTSSHYTARSLQDESATLLRRLVADSEDAECLAVSVATNLRRLSQRALVDRLAVGELVAPAARALANTRSARQFLKGALRHKVLYRVEVSRPVGFFFFCLFVCFCLFVLNFDC